MRKVEEQEDDGGGNTADGEVDIVSPAPGDMVGESAAEEGPNDGGNAKACAKDTGVFAGFANRDHVGDDDESEAEDATSSETGDSATDDQDIDIGGRTADGGASLEQEN